MALFSCKILQTNCGVGARVSSSDNQLPADAYLSSQRHCAHIMPTHSKIIRAREERNIRW